MIIEGLDIGAEVEEAQSDLRRAIAAAEGEDLPGFLAACDAAFQRVDFASMLARYELARRVGALRCEEIGKAAA